MQNYIKFIFLSHILFIRINFATAFKCYDSGNFTANSTYANNRYQILSSLAPNVASNGGFFNNSIGQEPNKVYALGLCRGDYKPESCFNCVNSTSHELMTQCPNQKEAFSWESCLVRYANHSFFGILKLDSVEAGYNTGKIENNTTTNLTKFYQIWEDLMEKVIDRASSGSSRIKYATDEVDQIVFPDIYALVQCTPDLSQRKCSNCLRENVLAFQTCCSGQQGGYVTRPSCILRWDLYPFYNASASPSSSNSPLVTTNTTNVNGKRQLSWQKVVGILAAIIASVVLFIAGYCFLSRRGKRKYENAGPDIPIVESLQFDFAAIQSATRKFSYDNKLGEGGFGVVYKGTLPSGQNIAVKRLSRNSGQGAKEFKNEVVVVAKLQHRNLVRLLGFCLEEEEKILVYEFVPNKSLDFFIYGSERRGQLDWSRRYNIIGGIARGILYLHRESGLTIIHRDLKPSNILLDGDMNPKISDFGMARIFGVDQIQGSTNRIVGTYGYMSPEYAMHGQFSVKSDIYSFGVLVLEIIAGKKNSSFHQIDVVESLVSYAWKLWRAEAPLELLDPTLRDSYSRDEAIRCIHLEDPSSRPTVEKLVFMLNNYSVTLPTPRQPAFFLHGRTEHQSSQSTGKLLPLSINETSITDVQPR